VKEGRKKGGKDGSTREIGGMEKGRGNESGERKGKRKL